MRKNYNPPSSITIGVIIAVAIIVPSLAASALLFGLQSDAPTSTAAATGKTTSSSSAVSSTTANSSESSSAAIVPGPCVNASKYTGLDSPAPMGNGTLSFPILAIPANSAAEVCVIYSTASAADNFTLDLTKGATIGTFGTLVYPNGTVTHPFVAAPGITVTPNQTKLALGGSGPTMTDVAYTIHTNASRGFYFLNIGGLEPVACNNEFRLAVGYNFTASNETGDYFPLPAGFSSCSPSGGAESVQVYLVKGLTVVPLMCGTVACDVNDTS